MLLDRDIQSTIAERRRHSLPCRANTTTAPAIAVVTAAAADVSANDVCVLIFEVSPVILLVPAPPRPRGNK